MDKALMSRAMRQLARHRVEQERKDPKARQRRKEIVAKAGQASWDKLTKAEREARIARMVAARYNIEYLRVLPKASPKDGRVLVHNSVRPTRHLDTRGFRAWLQPKTESLAVCDCGWAVELGPHYRVAKHKGVG
jgi:hypothetical protein